MSKIEVNPGQLRFDPLDWQDQGEVPEQAAKSAKAARDTVTRAILKDWPGRYQVKGWRLTGQLRPYKCFGVPDGRVRTVYYLDIREVKEA